MEHLFFLLLALESCQDGQLSVLPKMNILQNMQPNGKLHHYNVSFLINGAHTHFCILEFERVHLLTT